MRTYGKISFLIGAMLLLPACGESGTPEADSVDSAAPRALTEAETAQLNVLRQAAARYENVGVAMSMGYMRDPNDMCVTAEMEGFPAELGAMGVHYLRPDLLGLTGMEPRVAGTGTHTDWDSPGVLIYEPQADGSMQLVAIENLVFDAGWKAAGNTAPPSFMGTNYVTMIDDPATPVDEAHGFEPHYEMHIWIPRDNPTGIFTPFNPAVSCQHHAPAGN